MKVWEANGDGRYKMAMAIVVAANATQARELAQECGKNDGIHFAPEDIKELSALRPAISEPAVVSYCYFAE